MTAHTITTADEIYAFIAQLKAEAEKQRDTNFATELDNAFYLGSSGLEILDAIRKSLIENRGKVESLLGADGQNKAAQVIAFVDRAFGR